jgi:hypothetical protein
MLALAVDTALGMQKRTKFSTDMESNYITTVDKKMLESEEEAFLAVEL